VCGGKVLFLPSKTTTNKARAALAIDSHETFFPSFLSRETQYIFNEVKGEAGDVSIPDFFEIRRLHINSLSSESFVSCTGADFKHRRSYPN
jgi:hypothetical protein